MTRQVPGKVLMDEDGIRITHCSVTTPHGEFALADIVRASHKVHRPLWGPFLLASLGTLTLVAAVQTMFWGDGLAAAVMLLGGIFWRIRGVRHIIVLKTASKKVDAWYAEDREQCDRALGLIQRAIV